MFEQADEGLHLLKDDPEIEGDGLCCRQYILNILNAGLDVTRLDRHWI